VDLTVTGRVTYVTMPNLVILDQSVQAYLRKSPEKKLTPHVPPFKVTQVYWNQH